MAKPSYEDLILSTPGLVVYDPLDGRGQFRRNGDRPAPTPPAKPGVPPTPGPPPPQYSARRPREIRD